MKLMWAKKNNLAATLSLVWLLLQPTLSSAKCPFGHVAGTGEKNADARRQWADKKATSIMSKQRTRDLTERSGDGGIPDGGFSAVKEDIKAMLTNSQDFWPADFGNYGGLMIRLAWHCAGSFRESDGRGGCDGGRIRFDPELTWMDNGNLDKALKLLEPIKEKYGSKLSWGDLVILTGTTAMESMGLPDPGFCGGRIDDPDGAESLILGPSDEQEAIAPCVSIDMDGKCNLVEGSPIGPTTIGLIYVNPAGPIDNPNNPNASGADIRRTFGKMGFNDTETVALVGGGHAFGKCHGACMEPPCGEGNLTGIGPNTFTAGFEGQWSTTPTMWSNEYFNNLFNFDWVQTQSPAGQVQWTPNAANGTVPDIFMLTADLAMAQDELYRPISQQYASDKALLEKDFGAAWYRLVSSDMGPATRCIGEFVRPAQHWQHTLPEASSSAVDHVAVRSKIQELLDADDANYNAFVNLAYQCYSTFRMTDYRGGCNGARIRFSPESEWEVNAGTADALATLQSVKEAFPDASLADIIVLAGQTAVEGAGGNPQPFCGGRVDATDGHGSEGLEPRVYEPPLVSVIDDMQVKGLTPEEAIALMARPTGSSFSNQYFKDMLPYVEGASNSTTNSTSASSALTSFTDYELAVLQDAEFLAIVNRYAEFEEVFQEEFAKAWEKIMTVDRYDGPFANACKSVSTCTTSPCFSSSGEEEPTVSETESSGGAAGASVNMAMVATAAAASIIASSAWFSM